MIRILLFVLVSSTICFSQKTLFLGNNTAICKDFIDEKVDTVQLNPLEDYDLIYIFSGARSVLTTNFLQELDTFLTRGKGIYIGSENWPMQSEARILTQHLFQKEFWENQSNLSSSGEVSDHKVIASENIDPGRSVATFPMDVRLKVEVWLGDEPLILSSEYLGGRIILDGGYSRFYCPLNNDENKVLWDEITAFLLGN